MMTLLAITKALADENRVRALMMLRHGELCVCQIIEVLKLAPSTVSKHMSVLRQAGLVTGRKEGRWMYYSLSQQDAPKPVQQALQLVLDNTSRTASVRQDDQTLRQVLKTDRETLCRQQMGR